MFAKLRRLHRFLKFTKFYKVIIFEAVMKFVILWKPRRCVSDILGMTRMKMMKIGISNKKNQFFLYFPLYVSKN